MFLENYEILGENQGVFRANYFTCDNIFVIHSLWCSDEASDEIEGYRVRSPLTSSVVSLSKRLYPQYLVLVSTQ